MRAAAGELKVIGLLGVAQHHAIKALVVFKLAQDAQVQTLAVLPDAVL